MSKEIKQNRWEEEFDNKFRWLVGTTEKEIKQFISQLLKAKRQEILQIVIEDVPHKYQKRLLESLTNKGE